MDVEKAIAEILLEPIIAVDTETTGLRPYHGDEPFSIVIAGKEKTWYFNLNEYPGVKAVEGWEKLDQVFLSDQIKIFHNAKFDIHHLSRLGFRVEGRKLDTWFLARLYDNDHFSYSLADVAERYGFEKSKAVDEYIKEHNLKVTKNYKEYGGKCVHNKQFALVPLEIIQPYAEKDARITYDLGILLLKYLSDWDNSLPSGRAPVSQVIDIESRLVDTLYNMEARGIKIDREYCQRAYDKYREVIKECDKEFKEITGETFVKGQLAFKRVFADKKEFWKYTERGNPRFDMETLATFNHPAVPVIMKYGEAKKQSEYFANFLYEADSNDVIHPDFVQAGTATGRLSCRAPNLQNLTSTDKYGNEDFSVRRAFIPRLGFFFVMIDYKQIEYRVMLCRAKANNLINKVLGGLDVHEATAESAGVTRNVAKTVNFLSLYGGGVVKLAATLNCDADKAREIQNKIFNAAPEVRDFIRSVSRAAEDRKYITNFMGRRYQFPQAKFSYKATNHLIQGECADILKVAMNRLDEFLKPHKSKMVCTIHDEIVFEVHKDEAHLILDLKNIMETVYQGRLPLSVDVEYSIDNLADKEPFPLSELERGKETRDIIQGARAPQAKSVTQGMGVQDPAGL